MELNIDIDFLKFAQTVDSNPELSQNESSSKIQSVVVRNEKTGSSFLNIFGNTYPIKDKLKDLGFKFFKGVWGKNVSFISESDKESLRQLNVDLQSLETPQETNQAPEQPPDEEKEVEKTDVEKKLDEMKYGIDLAMKQTGSERMKGLLGFVDRMIEVVANMTDEAAQSEFVKDFLAFSSKFHGYSFHNQMLIWVQNNNATYVNGFRKWMELGRQVKNWDKKITILAPMFYKREVEKPDGGVEEVKSINFRTVDVYDISDTEPIPNWEKQTGKKSFEPQSWRLDENTSSEEISVLVNAVNEWAKDSGIEIESAEMNYDLGGFASGGKIKVNNKYQGINLFSTLVHECAHEVLHFKTLEDKKLEMGTRQEAEIDAETTAYIVLKHYGFETVDTPNYLALWKAKGEDVKKRRDNIRKSVSTIINGIDSKMKSVISNEDSTEKETVEASNKKKLKLNNIFDEIFSSKIVSSRHS
jgi:hypothetical protein